MTTSLRVALGLLLSLPLFAWGQLTVNELVGFGGGGSPIVQIEVTSSTNDYDICAAIQATGVDPAVTRGGRLTLVLSNGVIVGATSSSAPAMQSGDCGSSWQPGWSVTVVVASGESARIQGKGGAGGRGGFYIDGALNVVQRPGGGGGAGTQVGAGGINDGDAGTATAGGAGGTMAAIGGPGLDPQAGFPGGDALEATDSGPDINLAPESGATLEVWGGGGGGGGAGGAGSSSGVGGGGGNPGASGDSGTGNGFAPGGANGLAYSEPGSASVIEGGAGTIDDLGT